VPSTLLPRSVRLLLVIVPALVLLASCGGDDEPAATSTSTTATAGGDHSGHGTSGNMGIEPGTVADVAALGAGPRVGDRWEVPVGLNICGRFVDAPAGGPVDGVTAAAGAKAIVEPTDDATSGHGATLGSYAAAAGVTLSTGRIELPSGIVPAEIEVEDTDVSLDGASFSTGDRCGSTAAEVQVWVYSAEAVASGEGILTVVEDPEQVPFAQEGMALVIALTPESSLPTLPPSALGLG